MAEAANEGIEDIISHCHSQRLVPLVCTVVSTDRNPKLRQYCATFLFEVIFVAFPPRQRLHDLSALAGDATCIAKGHGLQVRDMKDACRHPQMKIQSFNLLCTDQ